MPQNWRQNRTDFRNRGGSTGQSYSHTGWRRHLHVRRKGDLTLHSICHRCSFYQRRSQKTMCGWCCSPCPILRPTGRDGRPGPKPSGFRVSEMLAGAYLRRITRVGSRRRKMQSSRARWSSLVMLWQLRRHYPTPPQHSRSRAETEHRLTSVKAASTLLWS